MKNYHFPMFPRLEPLTPWTGGRVTDTDVLELAEAAAMASIHAGATVTIKDFLRAAGRGEIFLKTIIHNTVKVQSHDGGIYCNAGQENENIAPAGAVPTLPLTACQHLATTGRASWRTFDGFEMHSGSLCRYTKGVLVAGEPDFETVPDDCRVTGNAVHALADAFKMVDDTKPQAAQTLPADIAPVVPEREPLPVTTGDIAHAFNGLRGWNDKAWKDNLGTPPKWLQACIVIRGSRGVSETRWSPVSIGAALVELGHARPNNIRAKFQTMHQLKPWFDAWKTYESDNFDTV